MQCIVWKRCKCAVSYGWLGVHFYSQHRNDKHMRVKYA